MEGVMLPIDGLKSTDVETSKNKLLKALWDAVIRYNRESRVGNLVNKFEALGGREKHQKAMALHDVMVKAGRYLTSKPPQPGATNRSRWKAIKAVAEAAGREAEQLGIKLVHGPANFRKVSADNNCVWLEVIDPLHRDQGMLSAAFKLWMDDPTAIKNKSSFWGYGDAELTVHTVFNGVDNPILYDTLAKSLVEYNRGLLKDSHNNNVDTTQMKSLHTGRGWGIFACDTLMRLFVSDHQAEDLPELIRHTTLTAGAPVLSAGEIAVKQGRILALSNETGHYRLPCNLFLRFICQFTQIPGNAIAMLVEEGGRYYATCDEIRHGNGDPEQIKFKDDEAKWARTKLPQVGWPRPLSRLPY